MLVQRLENELFKQAKRETKKIKASLKNPEIFIELLEGKVPSMDVGGNNMVNQQNNPMVIIPNYFFFKENHN